jgi:tetratricopeptide (TPR) repeat protein
MTFDEVLAHVFELLQWEKRVSYRALKRRFDLDDEYLEGLKDEIIKAKRRAIDEDGSVLVWLGETPSVSEPTTVPPPPTPVPSFATEREPLSHAPKHLAEKILTSRSALEGERKQGTVLYCDLVHSTAIAARLVDAYDRLAYHYARTDQATKSLLDGTLERFWLGMSLYFLSLSYYYYGNLPGALETVKRLHAVGEMTGDRRLQVNTLQLLEACLTAQGDWAEGIAACQRALASSPADYELAVVTGNVGYAYLEQGDLTAAIPLSEIAAQQACQYQVRQAQGLATIRLGEAYHLNGHLEQARDVARQGLAIAQGIQFLFGVGLAQRALGRIAHTIGSQTEAETHLQDALEMFLSIEARYELARTHLDLSSLAHTHNDQGTAITHLSTAYAWFKKLQVPKWMERTEQLAREYGVTLTEDALEELTEGSS